MTTTKTIIITGAASGIGLATTKLLASAGYKIYATTPNLNQASQLQQLANKFNQITILSLDVTSETSINHAVKTILMHDQPIDVLINNAGIGIFGPAEIITIEEAKHLFDVNFFGVMQMTNAVIPNMRQNKSGKIINLSSAIGVLPDNYLPIYAASKFALQSLVASYANDLKPWNIQCVLIQPGAVLTQFASSTTEGSRFTDADNPYQPQLANKKQQWQQIMQSGQPADTVATTILNALTNPKPDLWIQTNSSITACIKAYYCDSTGNNFITEPTPYT